MRKMPYPPRTDAVIMPRSRHVRATCWARSGSGVLLRRSFTRSRPEQQAAAAHVADAVVALLQRQQPVLQPLAEHRRALGHAIAQDDLDHLEADGGGQRIGGVRRVEEEAALGRHILDLRRRQHGGERQAGAKCLGEREILGHHAVALAGEQSAGAAEPGLRLVEDQMHVALAAHLAASAAIQPSGGSSTPPELRIGSTMQAASAPLDWRSTSSKPNSSSLCQS